MTAAASSAVALASQPLQGTPVSSHSMPSASTALAGNAKFEAASRLNAAVHATAAASALSPLVEPHVIMPSISAAANVTRRSCIIVDLSPYQQQMQTFIRIALFRLCKLLA